MRRLPNSALLGKPQYRLRDLQKSAALNIITILRATPLRINWPAVTHANQHNLTITLDNHVIVTYF
jgi:hypothetical protein